MDEREVVLKIEDLRVQFDTLEGTVRAVKGLDLTLRRGETLGLVGESGCGKSITARAVMNLVPKPGRITGGRILFRRGDEEMIDIASLHPTGNVMRSIRGKHIAMIFQEPMTSLSPVHTIGSQIMEVVRLHEGASKRVARERAIEALHLVGIPSPAQKVDLYPFELSGGMRQRAMIAMALVCRPKLLIADEPTTALDVTIQAQILELLQRLQEELDMAIIMITHDLSVVAAIAHRVSVMYHGRVVEAASTYSIFREPKHPYTVGLMQSLPLVGRKRKGLLYSIEGSVPDPYEEVPGCSFHPRCPVAVAGVCNSVEPPIISMGADHTTRCVLYEEEAG